MDDMGDGQLTEDEKKAYEEGLAAGLVAWREAGRRNDSAMEQAYEEFREVGYNPDSTAKAKRLAYFKYDAFKYGHNTAK